MPLSAPLDEHLRRLAAQPVDDADALRRRVDAHLDAAEAAAAESAFVDIQLARRIAASCQALLEASAAMPEAHRRLALGACRYFTASDDDEDDFDSIIGFEDDAEVVNHVAARIGRDDLIVELD